MIIFGERSFSEQVSGRARFRIVRIRSILTVMVAGARYEAVRMDLEAPSQLFVGKHMRFVA